MEAEILTPSSPRALGMPTGVKSRCSSQPWGCMDHANLGRLPTRPAAHIVQLPDTDQAGKLRLWDWGGRQGGHPTGQGQNPGILPPHLILHSLPRPCDQVTELSTGGLPW